MKRGADMKKGADLGKRAMSLTGIIWGVVLSIMLATAGAAFEVSPQNPEPGQEITISGTADPGQSLKFQSSFTMNLPVTGGEYEFETTVQVPQKPNRFTVVAKNVQDFNAGVKMIIWITKGFQANGGSVYLSHADVPPGEYTLKMFGQAIAGASMVPVDISAETEVIADSSGKYSLAIDTTGIPAGEYRIQGAGEERRILLGGAGGAGGPAATISPSSSSTSSSSGSGADDPSQVQQVSRSVGVSGETIRWYAEQTGLDAANESALEEAERLLRQRLEGGYWKIIPEGEPLTEEAGVCQQKYCLVRGADACTVCRDKDILRNGGGSRAAQPTAEAASGAGETRKGSYLNKQNDSPKSTSSSTSSQDKGIIDRIMEWFGIWIGISFGGL